MRKEVRKEENGNGVAPFKQPAAFQGTEGATPVRCKSLLHAPTVKKKPCRVTPQHSAFMLLRHITISVVTKVEKCVPQRGVTYIIS